MKKMLFALILPFSILITNLAIANSVHKYVIEGEIPRFQEYLDRHPMTLEEFMAPDENGFTTMELAVKTGNFEMMEFVSAFAQKLARKPGFGNQRPANNQVVEQINEGNRAVFQNIEEEWVMEPLQFQFDEELKSPRHFFRFF